MGNRAGVGYSEAENSFAAGQEMARQAMASGGLDRCDVAVLLSTCHHQPEHLRDGVRDVLGAAPRLVGGWAVGTFSNDRHGYNGFQAGLACLDLGGAVSLFRSGGLADREAEVGEELGRQLAAAGVDPQQATVLLYDSVNRTSGRMKLNMATPLLDGMRRSMQSLPKLVGAGLVGDMKGQPTYQWFDDAVSQQTAAALVFGEGVRMHTALLRGVSPVGGYHVVTKAEGAVVLEIDGRPAVPVISELLGGSRDPSEFGFYVMLGVNQGDPWAPFAEENYSNCMCLRADLKRDGLVMFEPELTEGTRFQLMSRHHDFAYVRPKVDALFESARGERPFFALYINCAGRASAYAGIDEEDSHYVQDAIGGRVPLLGFYTGCEIGPLRGEAKPMDWTGVLCLFTDTGASEEVS